MQTKTRKIATSELSGLALDWAVERTIGWHFNIAREARAYGNGLPELIENARRLVTEKFGETIDVPEKYLKAVG